MACVSATEHIDTGPMCVFSDTLQLDSNLTNTVTARISPGMGVLRY